MGSPRTRDVDPDVAHYRAKRGGAFKAGDEDAAEEYGIELAHARIIAAAKKVAAQLPELPPEKLEVARSILLGGGR